MDAIKFYQEQNIKIDGDIIVGKTHLTPAGIQNQLYALVRDYIADNSRSSSLQMARNLIWVVNDCGYASGSQLVYGWYDTKKYFSAILLIYPYLDNILK